MAGQVDPFRPNLYHQKQKNLFCDVSLIAAMDGTK